MIGPKVAKPTRLEEDSAYELATLRDHDTCQRCGRYCGPVARDHRKNRSQGGRTVVENLQCLGLACHTFKTENPDAAVRDGWAVPGWANPAQFPARRWLKTEHGTFRSGWVLYVRDIEYFSWPSGFREIDPDEASYRMSGLHADVRA